MATMPPSRPALFSSLLKLLLLAAVLGAEAGAGEGEGMTAGFDFLGTLLAVTTRDDEALAEADDVQDFDAAGAVPVCDNEDADESEDENAGEPDIFPEDAVPNE